MAKSKANYVPNKNIKSITIQRGKKTTEVKNKDILDGAYVKKGVKFKKGGSMYAKGGGLGVTPMSPEEFKSFVESAKKGDSIDMKIPLYGEIKITKYKIDSDVYRTPEKTVIPYKFAEENVRGGGIWTYINSESAEENYERLFDDRINFSPVKVDNTTELKAKKRLEELRKELRAERISYSELAELQSLAKYIDKNDVELLEAAGVEEYRKGGMMVSKKPKMVRTIFEEEYFEDYGKGGNLAMSIKNNIEKIIERANENQDIKGYDIVLSGYSVKVSPDKRDNFWNDLEDIQQDYNVTFSVTDYDDLAIYTSEYEGDMFRTGGVAGSKHVDVTKGYRLPHGYKAVRGEDKNKNYSKGKPKVRVDKGWRLPKGYEVVEGGYNKKYEDGGMMANGGNVDYAWLVKYDEPNDEGDYEEILSNEVVIAEEDNKTRAIMKKAKMGQVITHNDADINGYAVSYTKVPLPKGKKKDSFGGRYGYEDGGNMNDCYCYEIGGL